MDDEHLEATMAQKVNRHKRGNDLATPDTSRGLP